MVHEAAHIHPHIPAEALANSLLVGTVKAESTRILSVRRGQAKCTFADEMAQAINNQWESGRATCQKTKEP